MTRSTSDVAVCCWRDSRSSFEQPRILDGDDGLSGEVLHQRDLLVAEWSNFLTKDNNRADKFFVLKHGNGKYCPGTGELGKLRSASIEITKLFVDVGDLNGLLGR